MSTLVRFFVVATTGLALVACGQNSALVSDTEGDPASQAGAGVQGSVDFGKAAAVEGAEITVSQPKRLAPGSDSWWIDEEGQAVEVTITLKNTSARPFEPYVFSVDAQADGLDCELIFDSEIGLDGVPIDSVAKGKSVTWRSGYLCAAVTGAPLEVSVSEDTSSDALVRFTGTMP
jgi:hypothetical protein